MPSTYEKITQCLSNTGSVLGKFHGFMRAGIMPSMLVQIGNRAQERIDASEDKADQHEFAFISSFVSTMIGIQSSMRLNHTLIAERKNMTLWLGLAVATAAAAGNAGIIYTAANWADEDATNTNAYIAAGSSLLLNLTDFAATTFFSHQRKKQTAESESAEQKPLLNGENRVLNV